MTIKEQKFGIELEFTGMTRERAAKKIQQVVTFFLINARGEGELIGPIV